AVEGFAQRLDLFLAELVALGLLLGRRIAVVDGGVQVAFVPAGCLVPAHACQAFDLPAEQVDLLVVLPALLFLGDQLDPACLDGALAAVAAAGRVPAVAPLPRADGGAGLVQFLGNLLHRPALPVERTRTAARVHARHVGS